MLRHLNRRGLNGITWALLTVYNLQYILRFSLTLMLSSVVTLPRYFSFRLSHLNISMFFQWQSKLTYSFPSFFIVFIYYGTCSWQPKLNGSPYPPPREVLSNSARLSPGNLHWYTGSKYLNPCLLDTSSKWTKRLYFQIHTQNYFKYFYHRPVNVYLRFKIAG
jgi:hypothetical protein